MNTTPAYTAIMAVTALMVTVPAFAATRPSLIPILDLRRMVDAQTPIWRDQLRRQCESRSPAIKVQNFDADSQPGAERICSRVIHDPKLGAYLEIVALAKRAGGRTQVAHALLSADDWDYPEQPSPDGGQPLLCDPRKAKLGRYVWNAKDDHMFELGAHPPIAIRINTGKCDASYLFWPRDLEKPEVEFELETDSPG